MLEQGCATFFVGRPHTTNFNNLAGPRRQLVFPRTQRTKKFLHFKYSTQYVTF